MSFNVHDSVYCVYGTNHSSFISPF